MAEFVNANTFADAQFMNGAKKMTANDVWEECFNLIEQINSL